MIHARLKEKDIIIGPFIFGVVSSTARGEKVSVLVSMALCVDHAEHDVAIWLIRQGLTAPRGLDFYARGLEIIR